VLDLRLLVIAWTVMPLRLLLEKLLGMGEPGFEGDARR